MINVENKQKTDLELANEALSELVPNITAADRKESGYEKAVVSAYLNGSGRNLDVAVRLLKFFRERIEARRKIIANED